jgi:drug/metabolite transporter (DMT)-like permease
MEAVGLAALASIMWGSGDFVAGLLTRRIHVLVVSLVAWTVGLVMTAGIVLAFDRGVPSAGALGAGLLAGVFGAVGLAALYQGLAVGRMGIVAPIAELSTLVPVLAGVVQGDRPSGLQIAGMVAAVSGAALAGTAPDHEGVRRREAGTLLALVAALGIGISIVFIDRAASESAAWAAFMMRTGSLPLVLVAIAIVRPSFAAIGRRDVGVMAAVGASDNLANVAFAVATATGLLSLVSVVAALVPVVTVLLARFVLHEHLTRHQLIGVVIALAGVTAIAAG